MGVWKESFRPKGEAGRVLSRCKSDQVHCIESSDARLTVAAFLQHCSGSPSSEGDTAKLRIAYRSYHPAPIPFRRVANTKGGFLSEHDPDEVLRLGIGRTDGRPYIEAVVPDAIEVTRGEHGADVDLTMRSTSDHPVKLDEIFTLTFRPGERPKCPCC